MRDLTLYEEPIRKYSSSDEELEFFHGFEDEIEEEFYSNEIGHQDDCQCSICRESEELFEVHTELEHSLLDEGFGFELERQAYPGISCFTAGNPYVLHCFPPFETELTKEQHKHLDIIANIIQRSFSSSKPITKVKITGHSSTWHKTSSSKLQTRSIQRAENAGNQLILRLLPMGLAKKVDIDDNEGRSNKVKWLGKSYSSTSGTQKAKNDRALNRRVEIFLKQVRPPKNKTCRSPEIIELIRKASVAFLSNDPIERKQMICLRKFIADILNGKKGNDSFWKFTVVGGGTHGSGHAVKRDKKMMKAVDVFCNYLKDKKLTPINISKALKKTHDDIFVGIKKLNRFVSGVPSGNPFTGDPIVEYTECKFVRIIILRSKSKSFNSVYKCYADFVAKGKQFSRCKK